jgi:hypothetical protein
MDGKVLDVYGNNAAVAESQMFKMVFWEKQNYFLSITSIIDQSNKTFCGIIFFFCFERCIPGKDVASLLHQSNAWGQCYKNVLLWHDKLVCITLKKHFYTLLILASRAGAYL